MSDNQGINEEVCSKIDDVEDVVACENANGKIEEEVDNEAQEVLNAIVDAKTDNFDEPNTQSEMEASDVITNQEGSSLLGETEKPIGNNESKVDDDDDSRKLFVGALSWETTEDDLRTYFEKWGRVTSCVIKVDKMTGNSRGFGFISMESEECIRNVIGAGEHRIRNKKIDPKPAKPTKEPVKKIFVGGIPAEITEEQIKEYFGQFGTVETLDLPFDTQKGKRKPFVFLSFTTEEAAKNATINEKQDICGSKCDVRMAVPKDQVNKNKMATWGPYGAGMYPTVAGPDYYGYDYSYGAQYAYDSGAYYSGYYGGYPYGYCESAGKSARRSHPAPPHAAYPVPPQPYVAPMRGAPAAGKAIPRGRGGHGFHPYARPQ